MSGTAGLFITFWAAPGKIDALVDEVKSMLAVVEREGGTLAYGFHRVSGELEGVSVYEVYESEEAQRIHGESPEINALKSRLPQLLGAAPQQYKLTPIPGSKGLPF